MKVNIGPYPERLVSTFHTDYMKKKYGYTKWPDKESYFERFLEKLEDAMQSFYNVFNCAYFDRQEQKVKVHIDRYDTYSMDHTLAQVIVPMLKQLKATKHGSPMVDDEDVPHLPKQGNTSNESNQYDLFASDEHDELVWSQYEVRWNWVINEMIWAFEQQCRDDWEGDYYKIEEGSGDGFPFGIKIVWEDREGRDAHAERMQNGFRLFGKYYSGLWD